MKRRDLTMLSRQGFTLVEMMVALFAGSVVISSAYFLSGRSTNQFNEQMNVADAQMSLRMAMEQIRRDFGRAAYLGSRDSTDVRNNICAGPPVSTIGQVTAATATDNGSLAGLGGANGLLNVGATATTNLTRADLIRLQGAFAAPVMFPVAGGPVVPPANVITLDPNITTFQMIFSDVPPGGGAAVYQPNRFTAVFAPGRGVRFESNGNYYFRRITASNGALPPTVTLDSDVPTIDCAPRDGAFLSVLSIIEYRMDPVTTLAATAADLDGLVATTPLVGAAQRAVLARRELNYQAGNPPLLPVSTSVVLDNAVEFQVDGLVNTVAPPGVPVFVQQTGGPASTAIPSNLRALIVTLSTRSAEGDRTRAHLQRAALNLPMLTFRGLDPNNQPYVSRVRTMRAEIFLQNTVTPP